MISAVFSATLRGVEASEVEVEVNIRGSEKPLIIIVGLPDAAVRESSQRVISALQSSAIEMSDGIKTVNLAPADLKKEGPSFDLPIALAIAAAGQTREIYMDDCCVVGELALDGAVRPIKGALSIALCAKQNRRFRLLIPEANAPEAALISGIHVIPIRSLRQAWQYLRGELTIQPHLPPQSPENELHYEFDFQEVHGQQPVKRAIEIAAAGGHNVLMSGSPGTGKSMIAKRIPSILPNMNETEAIETTQIHSIAGLLNTKHTILTTRPFRSPHHTISDAGLLGGGSNPSPGEISLAHHGVLFLDELPEFRRQTLETMRQPLEDGKVVISRAIGSFTFPARFMLVAAMNPCPCGYHGDSKTPCRCSPRQIELYRQRISGPLLDRFDIHIQVPNIEIHEITRPQAPAEPSSSIRQRVIAARNHQLSRFHNTPILTNAAMPPKAVRQFCQLDDTSRNYLEQAMERFHLSARAHDRILKLARTIADLANSPSITSTHLLEAIQYRTPDRSTR